MTDPMTGEPLMTGRAHWLEAERLLAYAQRPDGVFTHDKAQALKMAAVHAALAGSAPVYAFHQERGEVVADSPNILAGRNEACP